MDDPTYKTRQQEIDEELRRQEKEMGDTNPDDEVYEDVDDMHEDLTGVALDPLRKHSGHEEEIPSEDETGEEE